MKLIPQTTTYYMDENGDVFNLKWGEPKQVTITIKNQVNVHFVDGTRGMINAKKVFASLYPTVENVSMDMVEPSNLKPKFEAELTRRPAQKPSVKVCNKPNEEVENILIISDIHLPFEHKDYLDFCKAQYTKYNCNRVIFIGDVIDNHYSSFHQGDPDGYGGGEELARCIDKVQDWYEAFPNAQICEGNHDRILQRKAFASSVPAEWMKNYNEVLGTPNWEWVMEVESNGVLYVHGEAATARTKVKTDLCSVVQGHRHTEMYLEFINGKNKTCFAMQTGTGIDFSAYAFGYAKAGKQPGLGCAVVLDNGQTPILINMRK